MTALIIERDAKLSRDGRYRYWLLRRWGAGPLGVVLGINPSTADAHQEDATTRKLIGFGQRWGWGGYWLLNPFAFRATDQRELLKADDPVGPENDSEIRVACECAELVVCAWGAAKTKRVRQLLDARLAAMRPMLSIANTHCLGRCADGSPSHPLMLAYSTSLERFEVRS